MLKKNGSIFTKQNAQPKGRAFFTKIKRAKTVSLAAKIGSIYPFLAELWKTSTLILNAIVSAMAFFYTNKYSGFYQLDN